jgi:predicted nucleic acid-binding protein
MIVVSDTSILINLAWLGELELLQRLYGKIYIPPAVWHEVVENGGGKPGSPEIKSADWITVQSVINQELTKALRQDLDAGESEAIALALEMSADLILMDERLGRATAQYFGLKYIGLLGVLIVAKKKNLIPEIRPRMDRLRNEIGFYLSDALYNRVLHDSNEK